MAYATITDVQALMAKAFTVSGASTPNETQVGLFITGIAGEIDSVLSRDGVTVPVTAPAHFLAHLVRLNALGAASQALQVAFPDNHPFQGGGSQFPRAVAPLASAHAMWQQYQTGLAQLEQGKDIPVEGVARYPVTNVKSFFTDNGAVGDPNTGNVTDAWGDPIYSNPAISRERVF